MRIPIPPRHYTEAEGFEPSLSVDGDRLLPLTYSNNHITVAPFVYTYTPMVGLK